MSQLERTRTFVERAVGTRRAAVIWPFLVERGFVNEHMSADEVEPAVEAARQIASMRVSRLDEAGRESVDRARRQSTEARREAIATLLAEDAAEDSEVSGLRVRLAVPIAWEDLAAWIEQQAQAEGLPTTFVQVPVANDRKVVLTPRGLHVQPEMVVGEVSGFRNETLAFALPGENFVRRKAVARGGVLDELRQLSERLSLRYGWQPGQASTWVLTDIPPEYEPMVAETRITSSGFGVSSRIVLSVDPVTPAADVADFYRRVRRPTGRRALIPKQAKLAAFAASHAGISWGLRRQLWNHQHPDWAYSTVKNFARDARAANRRLLRTASEQGGSDAAAQTE